MKLTIFVILSLVIAYISRKSFFLSRSHGFYRFFAWEFILILFLINVNVWFTNPFDWNQIISWICLFCSLPLAVEGYRLLSIEGKSNDSRTGNELYKLEKTTRLVTGSIYRYIRHPLYSSLLFLSCGILLKSITEAGLILVLLISIALYLTAKSEEKENCQYFGKAYQSYKERTKMFIPFIW